MDNIIIKPTELQGEITNTRNANEKVKALKYNIDKKNTRLQSIDRFLECLGALNSAIVRFAEITEVDMHTLETIKAEWMGLDEKLASKTILNRVEDAFHK